MDIRKSQALADPTKSKSAKNKSKKVAKPNLDTYPQSTNVSSPVRGYARSWKGKGDNDTSVELDERGYALDGFVASDNSEDESDDYFEPVRDARKRSTKIDTSATLGPPITSDQRMTSANLSEAHSHFVEEFWLEAKKLEEKIRNEKGIRKPLFKDRHLREMAINWTLTVKEMLEIPGIEAPRVKEFGGRFIPILQNCYDNCEAALGQREDKDMDPNHKNVICIESDDEFGPGVDEEDLDQSEEPSKYFVSREVQALNARMNPPGQPSSRPSQPPAPAKKSAPKARKPRGPPRRSVSGSSSRQGHQNGSGGSFGSNTHWSSGVGKKQSAFPRRKPTVAKRASNGSSTNQTVDNSNIFKAYGKGSGSGTGSGTGGGGGMFGAMPT